MSFDRRMTLFASSIAAATLLAACGGGGGGGTTPSSPVLPPTSTSTPTPTPAPQTPSTTSGIAYVPGGFNNADPYSMTVVQFEDTTGKLLATPIVSEYGTGQQGIPIAQIAMGPDGSTAAAITQSAGLVPNSLTNASVANAQFSATGNPFDVRSALSQPVSAVVMPDNATVVATGSTNIGEITGLKAGSPTVQSAPYPYVSDPNMLALAVSPDGKTLISRGSSQTYIWSIAASSDPSYTYQLNSTGQDAALDGSVSGRGDMAFDPADGSKALFGWMATGDQLTLETGMPAAPAESATIRLNGSTLYSIAFTPDGKYAVIGSHDGIYVVTGVASNALTDVAQNGSNGIYATSFTDNAGGSQQLAAVYSVGVTTDGKYVEALAAYLDGLGVSHEALLAIPIDSTGKLGSASTLVPDIKTHGSVLYTDGTLFR